MSKHSVIILGLRVVTTCWSWAWSNRTSPSNGVKLESPLAACSVYGDLTCSAHTVKFLCLFNCQWHPYLCNWRPYVRLEYMPNMLSSWNKIIIITIIYFVPLFCLLMISILTKFPAWYCLRNSAHINSIMNVRTQFVVVMKRPWCSFNLLISRDFFR